MLYDPIDKKNQKDMKEEKEAEKHHKEELKKADKKRKAWAKTGKYFSSKLRKRII